MRSSFIKAGFWLLLIVAAMGIAVIGCEALLGGPPTAGPADEGPTTGNIRGSVAESGTGDAIEGATITTDPPTKTVFTDSEGGYMIVDLEPGAYTVTASKDGYNSGTKSVSVIAGEDVQANISLTPTGGSDLIVVSVDGPEAAGPGEAFTIAYEVKNQGDESIDISFTIHFYLSTDTTITTSDTDLGLSIVDNLSAGANSSGEILVSIPSSVAVGLYYLGAIVDSGSTIPETDESNNTGFDATQINFGPGLGATPTPSPGASPTPSGTPSPTPLSTGPDLIVVSVDGPAGAGPGASNITIAYEVKNQGDASTGVNFSVSFYLSTDMTITTSDILIGTTSEVILGAGATSDGTFDKAIPSTAGLFSSRE